MAENTTSAAFQRKLAERRALLATQAEENRAHSASDYDEFIPYEIYDKDTSDLELDRAINSIDILDAYVKWCGKMSPRVGKGQRENIMVSCPKPDHADKNPSAWINLDKQTWFCGTCQEGGDAYDIAAYGTGYPVPGYKDGATFHQLRRRMAEDFGYTFHEVPGGVTYISPPADPTPAPPTPPPALPTAQPAAPEPTSPTAPTLSVVAPEPEAEADDTVTEMFPADEYGKYTYPGLDWRKVVPEGSFLDVYMNQTRIDDVAEEYHFWNAMIAIGFALGRRVKLYDLTPVYGNLFVCTLGHSGSGKSKAKRYLDLLLDMALPHKWEDHESRGVRKVNSPGSAESLIHQFQKPVTDPANPKKIMYYASVSGMIDFNELSSLMGRAARTGNVLRPTLMQFYDMEGVIQTTSMSTGSKEAHEPFASALTTSQPASLKNLLSKQDDDSGFLNRWLFVAGPDKQKVAIGGAHVDMTPAVLPLQRILGWSGTFKDDEFMEWGPAANEKFTEFFHSRLYPDKIKEGSMLLTRLDLLMKKIILLLSANKLERVVSGQTVSEAISMYEYILACYDIPSIELSKTPMGEVEELTLFHARRALEDENKGITIRELIRSTARKGYTREQLVRALETLVKLGQLEVEKPQAGSRGRPTVRYRYVA